MKDWLCSNCDYCILIDSNCEEEEEEDAEALKRDKKIEEDIKKIFDWSSEDAGDSESSDEESATLSPRSRDYEHSTYFSAKGSHNEESFQPKETGNSSSSSPLQSGNLEDLHEEYLKLQLLYETRGQQLEQVKKEEMHVKENYSRDVKSLELRLTLVEGEKNRLSSSLQESQKLIADFRHENIVLKGKLSALELQFSAEKDAKQSALEKLESCEITIQSLEQQINGLARSENVVRLQNQSESIIKDLKLRHQEILQLKKEIDKLQENLNAKINESHDMSNKISVLQEKCEKLQFEKSETFNKLSANLEFCQRQCQKLLECGTIAEVSILRLQVQHLQEEKSKLEKQSSSLKENLLKTSENQELQNLQKEFSRLRQAWEKEKADLVHNKLAIEENLASASEAEQRLREMVKKYQMYVSSLKKKHQEKIDRFRTKNVELQTLKLEKEIQLLAIKDQYKQKIAELEQKMQRQTVGRNAESQTEEPVVSIRVLQEFHDMFIDSLQKISDEMDSKVQKTKCRTSTESFASLP